MNHTTKPIYNKVDDYNFYKDDTLSDGFVAGRLGDVLRNRSVLAKYSKNELVEIIWNLQQFCNEEYDVNDICANLKEIENRKEGR